jgi:hypothetical protein
MAEPTMQGAPVEARRETMAALISRAEELAQEARDLGGEVWDFGEEMAECERPTGAVIVEADNLVSYLEDRKKELGL